MLDKKQLVEMCHTNIGTYRCSGVTNDGVSYLIRSHLFDLAETGHIPASLVDEVYGELVLSRGLMDFANA